ncbi:MAG: CehA/McbA family metallohydrolase [Candidatus Latescibacteria bacterium]|nr:CehA/McbA family metallohydrolase [Candidatus Latescibacterota bacterium]
MQTSDAPITGLHVVAPSVIAVGEAFSIGVKVVCAPRKCAISRGADPVGSIFNLSYRGIHFMDNVPLGWRGTLDVSASEGHEGPDRLRFAAAEEERHRPVGRFGSLKFTSPGFKFITVRDPLSGLECTSNPIRVTNGPVEERLFWGDLHSQTYFSDGLRSPEELYTFARDEAFLDIFGLADHSECLTDRQWDYFTDVTNDFNEPGRFATLVGFEWTKHDPGHRNLYYPGDRGPIARADDPVLGNLKELHKLARDHGALLVPHHSANVVMGVTWEEGHDPEAERLVEIYSTWGNSERPAARGNPRPIRNLQGEKDGRHVQDALSLGYRMGLVGGGDIHDGRPGDEMHTLQQKPEGYRNLWRQGIMGVWATELTRPAIFQALMERRTFATTNVRTYLRFSVDGACMGSEIAHTGPRKISVAAASEVPFARVEIVRNGEDIILDEPNERIVEAEFEDPSLLTKPAHYYARLTREDGEMAWSSPVWVE